MHVSALVTKQVVLLHTIIYFYYVSLYLVVTKTALCLLLASSFLNLYFLSLKLNVNSLKFFLPPIIFSCLFFSSVSCSFMFPHFSRTCVVVVTIHCNEFFISSLFLSAHMHTHTCPANFCTCALLFIIAFLFLQ